jgi:cellulose synthase/poly-beta-1,6-N-acetylglucosamine synthase-like glycosyltransferase
MDRFSLLPTVNLLAFLLCAAFLVYVAFIIAAYLRERPQPQGDASAFDWHLLIPCLDEEAVIERTVLAARSSFPDAVLWCIDDASADRTGALLDELAAVHPGVHVVHRSTEEGRRGKGAALNHGWEELGHWVRARGGDPQRVIVGVIDADGELDGDALAVLAGPGGFADPAIGAVQIAVRIANRTSGDRCQDLPRWRQLLVDVQDLEFVGPIGAMQLLRRHTSSVAMGGNGQFTRLSVLDDIASWAGAPWHGALLEDFELGLHVLLTGSRTAYCHHIAVSQEGLPSVRQLIQQRSRWAQGSMQCGRYLPAVMASSKIGHPAALEVSYFLVMPWIQLLGTVVYLIAYAILIWYLLLVGLSPAAWVASGQWAVVPLVLIAGIGPFFVWGPIYRSRVEPSTTRRRSMALGVATYVVSNLHYAASWLAFVRYLRDRDDWVKTARVATRAAQERDEVGSVADQPGRIGARLVLAHGMPPRAVAGPPCAGHRPRRALPVPVADRDEPALVGAAR